MKDATPGNGDDHEEIVVTGRKYKKPGPGGSAGIPGIVGFSNGTSSTRGGGKGRSQQNRQTCPRLRPGAGLSGTLDGIENLLGTTSDVTGAAEGAILAFGVANAVVGDEPGAAGSFAAAGIAGTASTVTGGLKGLVQLGRGKFGAAGSTFLGLATGQAVKRGFGLFGRAVGIGRNEAGDAFSSAVSDQASKRAEAAGCGG